MSAFLEAAREDAEAGQPVFPLVPGEKMPAIPKLEGGNGLHDATTDLQKLTAWSMQPGVVRRIVLRS